LIKWIYLSQKRGGEDMKMKSIKFVGLLSTAMVAPALFGTASAAPAVGQLNKDAVYSRATSENSTIQSKVAAMASGQVSRRASDTLDRLLLWNEIMQDANALDHTPSSGFAGDQQGPTRNSRAFAMVSIAVFDAVNSFDRRFTPYNNIGRAPAGASKDAAIAYAAHRVLRVLHPRQAVRLDQLLSSDLSQINDSAAAVAAGRVIGLAAADAMINSRINTALPGAPATDGATAGEPAFGAGGVVARGATAGFFGPINGGQRTAPNWEPDPVGLARGVALGARWGNVRPFVLRTGDQFRIPPPPAPNTARFRTAFNEVATDGASADTPGSTTNPQFQFIGNFWGYDGASLLGTPPRLYDQIAVKVANDQGLTRLDSYARYLALINSVMGDSGIAAWDSKFFYNYWRPVTGVRRGAEDGDTATTGVPTYKPFGASVVNAAVSEAFTPPFPAYPSGHATFGAAIFEVMRAFFPNNTRFTFVSDEYNGTGVDPKGAPRPFVPVRFRSLRQAQEENGQSRIYNGVHWEYDNTEGQRLGENIAKFTLNNAFERR
jgi:membrane-associated phospholipid phosphatase